MIRPTLFLLIALPLLSINLFNPYSNEDRYGVKSFYFPFDKMKEASVYVYKNEETRECQYWVMKYDEDSKVFNTKIFDNNLNLLEITDENIVDKGSSFTNYQILHNKEKVNAELVSLSVFTWEISKTDKLTWHIKYEIDDTKIEIKKERSLIESDYRITYQGKSIKAISFTDQYEIKESKGRIINRYFFTQHTVYAKDIGIVEYSRKFEDGSQSKLILDEVKQKEDFLKMLNENLQK